VNLQEFVNCEQVKKQTNKQLQIYKETTLLSKKYTPEKKNNTVDRNCSKNSSREIWCKAAREQCRED
jgi:hypothetical protein